LFIHFGIIWNYWVRSGCWCGLTAWNVVVIESTLLLILLAVGEVALLEIATALLHGCWIPSFHGAQILFALALTDAGLVGSFNVK